MWLYIELNITAYLKLSLEVTPADHRLCTCGIRRGDNNITSYESPVSLDCEWFRPRSPKTFVTTRTRPHPPGAFLVALACRDVSNFLDSLPRPCSFGLSPRSVVGVVGRDGALELPPSPPPPPLRPNTANNPLNPAKSRPDQLGDTAACKGHCAYPFS